MGNDCLRCKSHYTQGGKCSAGTRNCLLFVEETRGKKCRTNIKIDIRENSYETPMIENGAKLELQDGKREATVEVVKINSLNLEKSWCDVTVEYHEYDKPWFVLKKGFKLIKS